MTEYNRPRIVLEPRPVFNSIDDLLQGVTFREPLNTSDSKSDAALERVVIDRKRYVLNK